MGFPDIGDGVQEVIRERIKIIENIFFEFTVYFQQKKKAMMNPYCENSGTPIIQISAWPIQHTRSPACNCKTWKMLRQIQSKIAQYIPLNGRILSEGLRR